MALALDITVPSRRGACPTLDAPTQTGDGLLARVRVAGSRLSPMQLRELAELAQTHGNGLVEVTARGNLQVRGLTPVSAPRFASAVTAMLPIAAGLVVDTSPLAGEDLAEQADPRPVAEAIKRGAAGFEARLGPKVSVVVDGSGQICLAALKADVRLVALDADRWTVTLGGGKQQVMDADGAVVATLALLGALAAMGPDARAVDLFAVSASSAPSPHPQSLLTRGKEALKTDTTALRIPPLDGEGPGVGWGHTLELIDGHTTRIALPFGAADAPTLRVLATAADAAGITTIRLAPDHTLLFDNAPPTLVAEAAALGFITTDSDPRRRISACIGSAGCASGHIPARELSLRLASHLPASTRLHVSGCTKGCAHPRPADITLVGSTDGIGLVIGGRAGDTPREILDEAGIIAALAARQEGR